MKTNTLTMNENTPHVIENEQTNATVEQLPTSTTSNNPNNTITPPILPATSPPINITGNDISTGTDYYGLRIVCKDLRKPIFVFPR